MSYYIMYFKGLVCTLSHTHTHCWLFSPQSQKARHSESSRVFMPVGGAAGGREKAGSRERQREHEGGKKKNRAGRRGRQSRTKGEVRIGSAGPQAWQAQL